MRGRGGSTLAGMRAGLRKRLRSLIGVDAEGGEDLGLGLPPGAPHYRAYVGPPEDYDQIAALQVGLLFAAGLRENHRLLDLGCGSLRAGRLLIPFLRQAHYYGVEPNAWLVQEGLRRELGGDQIVSVKQPVFAHFDDFRLQRLGVSFDWVLAQSVFSHCHADLTLEILRRVREVLSPTGLLVATFVEGDADGAGSGWAYPECTTYRWPSLQGLIRAASLTGRLLDWPHPRQRWFAASLETHGAGLDTLADQIRPPRGSGERLTGYDRQLTDDEIDRRLHREFVGGLWEELGALQLDFLRTQGLEPHHKLVDIGCGALRGGLQFIRYLRPGRYAGLDSNASLIRAGERELAEAGLQDREARLLVDPDFSIDRFGDGFDYALAHSLFTHLPANRIQRCLAAVSRSLVTNGYFFATFFESGETPPLRPEERTPLVTTYLDADPFHYHPSTFEHLARGLPLSVRNLGDWGHPRGQHMLEFRRL